MKKIYIKPQLAIVHTEGMSIMTASNTYNDQKINITPSIMSEGDGNDAAVKKYSVWDDEL